MKLLTIAVPCYNSEAYMENCVKSLLVGGDEVEILIVDDGSKDGTAAIADRLQAEHPGIIRAIHQPNKGHGGAVNTGIANASGLFFKVVDSDDRVRASAYRSILDTLRHFAQEEEQLDLLISNFVYDKEGERHHKVMHYRRNLPVGRVFGWEEAGKFRKGQYILMHSVIFRTQMLRNCGLQLPEHTFYVDNIYVFNPLPYVKKMYYLDVNFYYYFIGRDDQSVNEKVMISRLDQQMRVNRIMFDHFADEKTQRLIESQGAKELYHYMYNYLEIITTVSSILAYRSKDAEKMAMKDELWQYMSESDPELYHKLRYHILGFLMNRRSLAWRWGINVGYLIAQKVVGFN